MDIILKKKKNEFRENVKYESNITKLIFSKGSEVRISRTLDHLVRFLFFEISFNRIWMKIVNREGLFGALNCI